MNSYITQGTTITVQTAVLKETLEDNKDILNNEKELITKMFFKDAIKNRGRELEWENLERMIDMMRIAKIRQILKEKEKEHNENKNIL